MRLLQAIDWAADPQRPTVEDVQVDHRGTDVAMPEQFLHCPDVLAVLQQMRRERVTENVRTDAFGEPRAAHGLRNLQWVLAPGQASPQAAVLWSALKATGSCTTRTAARATGEQSRGARRPENSDSPDALSDTPTDGRKRKPPDDPAAELGERQRQNAAWTGVDGGQSFS